MLITFFLRSRGQTLTMRSAFRYLLLIALIFAAILIVSDRAHNKDLYIRNKVLYNGP